MIFILFVFHLGINLLSHLLGRFFLNFCYSPGFLLDYILYTIEHFYDKNPRFKDRLLMRLSRMYKKSLLQSTSVRQVKSHLKNPGYRRHNSFLQKLSNVFIFIVFKPTDQEFKTFMLNKKKTIRNYINRIKNEGIFSIIPRTAKSKPHNKKSTDLVRLIWDIHDNNPAWGKWKISLQLLLLGYIACPSTVMNYLKKPRPHNPKRKKRDDVDDDRIYENTINPKYTNHMWCVDFTCVPLLFTHVYVLFCTRQIFTKDYSFCDCKA